MSDKSNYLEGQYVTHMFRSGTFTKPTVIALALFTAAPNKEDGTAGTEVSGGSYARVDLPPDDANWDAPTNGGDTANSVEIAFPVPTADWGQVVAVGAYDALTGGNLLFSATLDNPKNVNNGDPAPKFAPGTFTYSEQ